MVDNLTPWEGVALLSAHCTGKRSPRVLLLLTVKRVGHEAKEEEGVEVEEVRLQQRLLEKMNEAALANRRGVLILVLRPPALGWT